MCIFLSENAPDIGQSPMLIGANPNKMKKI